MGDDADCHNDDHNNEGDDHLDNADHDTGEHDHDDKDAHVHDDNEDLDKQTYKPVLVREMTGRLWGPEEPRDTSNR